MTVPEFDAPGFFYMSNEYIFKPIGTVRTAGKYRFEAPRQGVFSTADGVLELLPEYGGDAIADLAGFDRIWLIFCFHLNVGHTWKSKVRPPFPADGVCRSLFATRSPYRVNPIGLSCAEIVAVESRRILLRGIDLLDGTPVLDIKPYIPEADSFPDSAVGWRNVPDAGGLWQVVPTAEFTRRAEAVRKLAALDLANFCRVQLCRSPLDASRKRLYPQVDGSWELGCRTWRIGFTCDDAAQVVTLLSVKSNYTAAELYPETDDRYADKDFHREFLKVFPETGS